MPFHFPGIPPYIDAAASKAKLPRPPHRISNQPIVRSVASRLSQVADMPQASREEVLIEARLDLAEIEVAAAACKAAIDEIEAELVAPGRTKPVPPPTPPTAPAAKPTTPATPAPSPSPGK